MEWLTLIGGVALAWFVLVLLFAPHIPYHIDQEIDATSDHFIHVIESTCNTKIEHHNRIDVLTDGPSFYPAMLGAIQAATESINLECYIFRKGEIAQQFIDALSERARAGVRVTVVIDAVGSMGSFHWVARPLRAAGARVEPYRSLKWHSIARINNRTHRELLIVDATVAFMGGAGIADWWLKPTHGKPMWRDMMARVEGPVVSAIQGVAAENWLECRGEILTGVETYKPHRLADGSAAFVVKSSPADRATASRVLFQTLVEASTRKVLISTPYFLPDKAFRRAICRTASRGVEMAVILPGPDTDQKWVRLASRRMYGTLFKAGVRIFEYRPGMTHVKALLVDDLWAVIGTTNVDNRSFEHNDEVNLAIRDRAVVERLTVDFKRDRSRSVEITADRWRRRPLWEKLIGPVAWILERQQ